MKRHFAVRGSRTNPATQAFSFALSLANEICLLGARLLVLALAVMPVPALEIQWTRMAGQWPVETSPLVGQFGSGGGEEILVLNRGGQLLWWQADGKALGPGQDGMAVQLPEGRWTTTPLKIDASNGAAFVVASVEGRVVGLDGKFQLRWQHKLSGETLWSRATPARLGDGAESGFVFSDAAGVVTCLNSAGKVIWTNAPGAGPAKAPPLGIAWKPGEFGVLAPLGSSLLGYDARGAVRWRRDLGSEVITRPELVPLAGGPLIVCGTAAGTLVALDLEGRVQWQCAVGETFSNWLVVMPRPAAEPLILFTGLWGNLHAVDVQGHRRWTHWFRSKTRAAPLVLGPTANGRSTIYVPTMHQRVYAFDDEGNLQDSIRLSGALPSALVPIAGAAPTQPDLLVATTTLLAYRLRPGLTRSPYGALPEPRDVTLQPVSARETGGFPTLRVNNPAGAWVNLQVVFTNAAMGRGIFGDLTARSAFELPLPDLVRTGAWTLRATASGIDGRLLAETTWQLPLPGPNVSVAASALPVRAWATPAFAAFQATRLTPTDHEAKMDPATGVAVENLYQDEVDEAALIVASTSSIPLRARILIAPLARADGVKFGGPVVLREALITGTVNGETVPDPLPALGDAGLIGLPPQSSAKVWMSVDAHGAEPGKYLGTITVQPMISGTNTLELPCSVEVLKLRLPREFPTKLCTWDYVPNKWFPSRTAEVLDDMNRHGVSIFPRSTVPPGRVDAAGHLSIDWSTLDAELARLAHRGQILFHLDHPPIEFATPKADAEKRPVELEYIRALRDHLRERGRNYDDYAFYLLDEPGLDYGPNVAILVDAGKLFREADPKLRTYTDPVPGLSWKDFERIEPLVDVWAPNMRLVSGLLSGDPRIGRIMKNFQTVWSYECVAQVKSLSPLRYNRANAWRAKYFGLSGIGFWTHSTMEVDPWRPGKSVNDEYGLVYPGDLPVPSIRWEAVRDGLEDVAALVLLEEAIQRGRAAGAAADLLAEAETVRAVALRDVMELSDEAFIESRDFLRPGDRALPHTWTDQELFRHHRRDIARLTLKLVEAHH